MPFAWSAVRLKAVNIKYAGYVQQDLPNVRQRPSVIFKCGAENPKCLAELKRF